MSTSSIAGVATYQRHQPARRLVVGAMFLVVGLFGLTVSHGHSAVDDVGGTTRPNVTVKVNTVPNAQWHDAMFT